MKQNILIDCLIFLFFFFFSIFLGQETSIIGYTGIVLSLGIYIYYFANKPVFAFLFPYSIFINLGNYLPDDGFGFPKFFTYKYFFLILSFLVIFSPKIKKILIRDDPYFRKLIYVAVLLNLYQIIVCIYIHLSPSYVKTIILIIRNFPQIFGIYIFLPVYILIKYNYKDFFFIIVFMCIALEVAFFITILTPLDIIKVVDYENRFGNTGPVRIYFQGTGYIAYCILFAIIARFIKLEEHKYNKYLNFGAVLYFVNILLSLTRSAIFLVVSQIVIIFYFFGNVYGLKFTSYVKKVSIIFLLISLSIFINPSILMNFIETFFVSFIKEDISSISRFTYELPRHITIIQNNLFFGTGFKTFWSSYEFGQTDMPFTANLGKYGIVGMFIFSLFHFYSFTYIFKFMSIFKNNYTILVNSENRLYIFLWLAFSIALLSNTLLNPLFYSTHLMNEAGMVSLGFTFGVVYGCSRVMISNILINEIKLKKIN